MVTTLKRMLRKSYCIITDSNSTFPLGSFVFDIDDEAVFAASCLLHSISGNFLLMSVAMNHLQTAEILPANSAEKQHWNLSSLASEPIWGFLSFIGFRSESRLVCNLWFVIRKYRFYNKPRAARVTTIFHHLSRLPLALSHFCATVYASRCFT